MNLNHKLIKGISSSRIIHSRNLQKSLQKRTTKNTLWLYVFLTFLFSQFATIGITASNTSDHEVQLLKSGWRICSSADLKDSGEKISSQGFDSTKWYTSSVPSTVLSALIKNGVYRDLYFGRNLENVARDPFVVSWWYRTEFDLDAETGRSENIWLLFDGINYSANIYLNGSKIASDDSTYGAFRRFEFDVTRLVRKERNVLAVQVFPPKPGDFTIGFVDWNPCSTGQKHGVISRSKAS